MTALADLLIRQIAATGPMTLADYMAECLTHPLHGYYTTRDPFGQTGDFTTAPEISQMFGELLGLCLAQNWLDNGAPDSFTLAELGPGRGTLMADVLRATRGILGFHAAAKVTLVETSPTLRALQGQCLPQGQVQWLDHTGSLPDAPLYLLANEFFDALPIRQFTRHDKGWSETMVGLAGDRLSFGRSAPAPLMALDHRLADTLVGAVVETCPGSTRIMATIADRINRNGGLALIMDYGGWHSRGNTFQAMANHAFTDPLAAPGEADLTAHVDFEALAVAAIPARTAYTTQGNLLQSLGIAARSARLAAELTGEPLQSHLLATRRLTDPAEMGELFKALAVFPAAGQPPPGFA